MARVRERVTIFEWADDASRVEHPLQLVARAMALADGLQTLEQEGRTGFGWGGILDALTALVEAKEYEKAGELLTSLEAIVRPQMGNRWPLDRE